MFGGGKKDDADDKALQEIKALHEKITVLEKKAGDGDALIAQLQKQLQDAQTQIKALESSIKQVDDLQTTAGKLEKELAQLA